LAAIKFGCGVNLAHFLAFSPSSTSRRIASERPGPSGCLEAQASTLAMNLSESRTVRVGSVPVAGRPAPVRFPPALLRVAFFMSEYYVIQAWKQAAYRATAKAAEGKACNRCAAERKSTFGLGDGSLADWSFGVRAMQSRRFSIWWFRTLMSGRFFEKIFGWARPKKP